MPVCVCDALGCCFPGGALDGSFWIEAAIDIPSVPILSSFDFGEHQDDREKVSPLNKRIATGCLRGILSCWVLLADHNPEEIRKDNPPMISN